MPTCNIRINHISLFVGRGQRDMGYYINSWMFWVANKGEKIGQRPKTLHPKGEQLSASNSRVFEPVEVRK